MLKEIKLRSNSAVVILSPDDLKCHEGMKVGDIIDIEIQTKKEKERILNQRSIHPPSTALSTKGYGGKPWEEFEKAIKQRIEEGIEKEWVVANDGDNWGDYCKYLLPWEREKQ